QKTPLHVAAEAGHTNVVTLLMSRRSLFLPDNDGRYFLDLAIRSLHRNTCVAVVAHERWREAMNSCSENHSCPIVGFIKHMPDVCLMVLDKSWWPSGNDTQAKDFHFTYDFRYLETPLDNVKKLREQREPWIPLCALNMMVKCKAVECLSHPVCITFLSSKWHQYGLWSHLLKLLVFAVFLVALSVFVTTFKFNIQQPDLTTCKVAYNATSQTTSVDLDDGQRFQLIIVFVYSVFGIVKEIAKLWLQVM
ncbi:hypothetical protein LSAT2_021079, partial [Lamellibrachia satsuma]